MQSSASAILQLYYELHINRCYPVTFFQEFDKLKCGFVTPDQFSRAFVLAGLDKVIQYFPQSFNNMTLLYTEQSATKYANMVDYA